MIEKSRVFVFAALLTFGCHVMAGQPAARILDPMASGGFILGPGVPNVLIGGKPAARFGDQTTNPLVNPGPLPCVGGNIITGSGTVLIGGLPAVRVGDIALTVCGPDTIILGAPTVLIGG